MSWVDDVDAVARDHLARWDLRPDGAVGHGSHSLVLPVRTADGVAAFLKVGHPGPEAEHEHLVLRRWGGAGAARLLRADPPHRVVLLERLHMTDLHTRPDAEACEVVAGLYGRLHVPAMPQLRSLASCVEQWTRDFAALPRNAPIPRRLVEQAITLGTDLAAHPAADDRVLHGDLHYANVLAADREPWVAISPRPMNGDPHFEIAPMLWHRSVELAGHVRGGVRARLFTLVDVAGLDEDRARAWVVVRVVHEATRAFGAGRQADSAKLTSLVALAKAVQD